MHAINLYKANVSQTTCTDLSCMFHKDPKDMKVKDTHNIQICVQRASNPENIHFLSFIIQNRKYKILLQKQLHA